MDFSFIDKKNRTTQIINGKKTRLINADGLLQLAAHGMFYEHLPKYEKTIERYCQYISVHGYKGGANKAFLKLKSMNYDKAVIWLENTHKKYVTDDVAMVTYVLQTNLIKM